jgi:hypothetical protein
MKLHTLGTATSSGAALLEYPSFPLAEQERTRLTDLLMDWLSSLTGQRAWRSAIFLQGEALHEAAMVNRLTEQAAEWMPDLGLGIRPGNPPHLLRPEDLSKLRWNEFPKPQHATLFHLTEEGAAFRSGIPAYCGSGALLSCLLDVPVETYLARQRALWLPTIAEPAFRAHPFYVPLLGAPELQESAQKLQAWTGDVRVYLRESAEDHGMLLFCSNPDDLHAFTSRLQAEWQETSEPAL